MQQLIAEAKKAGVHGADPARTNEIDRLAGRGVHNGVVADVSDAGVRRLRRHRRCARRRSSSSSSTASPIRRTSARSFASPTGSASTSSSSREHESVGLTPAAVKASAGASEWVPVAQVTNLARAIEALKEQGYWVYAAAADGDRADAIDFTRQSRARPGQRGEGHAPERARALRPGRHDPDVRPRRLVQRRDRRGGALLRGGAADAGLKLRNNSSCHPFGSLL